jgi:hypothetical protein
MRGLILARLSPGKLRCLSTMADFYSECLGNGAYKWYKNGQWLDSDSGKTVKILNPSTNEAAFFVQGSWNASRVPLGLRQGPVDCAP